MYRSSSMSYTQLMGPFAAIRDSYGSNEKIAVTTKGGRNYKFYFVNSKVFRFEVKANKNACIALSSNKYLCIPNIEIIIGCENNMRSMIRHNEVPVKSSYTTNILDGDSHRSFSIRWTDTEDTLYVKSHCKGKDILVWKYQHLFQVNYVGLSTGWGSDGDWKIIVPNPSAPPAALYAAPPGYPQGGFGGGVWVDVTGGQVPPGAVVGGQDCSGEPIYVARARHEGALIPGKLASSHGCAYVPWGGQENGKPEYQVLVGGPNNWIPTSGSNIPPGAFPGGEAEDGEPLFIGRVRHEGSVTTGKVQQSHGVCYIPFGGQELGFPDYEILMP